MTIPLSLSAQIPRLHEVEHWRARTIARQLHVHRDTAGCSPRAGCRHPPLPPMRIDAFRPFIAQTLATCPTLTAARLHAMAVARGYVGGGDHFRHLIATLRPGPVSEAYLRLRTLPGEQAQVDWARFGHVQIGRRLWAPAISADRPSPPAIPPCSSPPETRAATSLPSTATPPCTNACATTPPPTCC